MGGLIELEGAWTPSNPPRLRGVRHAPEREPWRSSSL